MDNQLARNVGIEIHDHYDKQIRYFDSLRKNHAGETVSVDKVIVQRSAAIPYLTAGLISACSLGASVLISHPFPAILGLISIMVGTNTTERSLKCTVRKDRIAVIAESLFPGETIPGEILSGELIGSEMRITHSGKTRRIDQLFRAKNGLIICDTKSRNRHIVKREDIRQVKEYAAMLRAKGEKVANYGYIRTVLRHNQRSVKWNRVCFF